MDAFQVHILAADKTFYEGPCVSLTIPTSDGELGIWAHHSAMIAATSPGMVKVEKNEVVVLVDSIERPEEIDAVRARREADQAREIILQKKSRQEYQIAQGNLARALNRLRISSRGLG